jgi:hypothetical protein
MNISPKVVAGGSGVGLAGAIASVAVWVVTARYHIEIPPEIVASVTTILTFAGSVIGGWLVPH